ncbi:MAG: hypothetical protein E7813_05015 [Bradyrhizobium sp.]|uniref:hypothetical protein n=1 Tax=Bradyrhizobium sp. TaxID=376 RepID=UPI001216F51C|nr:hypothetical protein [Bradyrhizobium sp.]THD71887.1 MAG: hypothetical protein E7813_05015 [Bradyrhizobium sp.]
MAKRGRRPKGEYPEKKRVFASRVREDTWTKLQQAAVKSGRSVSQEFEHQLRRGLDEDEEIEGTFGDLRTYALMKLAAQAVNSLCSLKDPKIHWTADANLFAQALEVITRTLKVFHPHQLTSTDLMVESPQFDAPVLEIVREVQTADPARQLKKSTKRQRAMARLKDQLGELADRATGQLPEMTSAPQSMRPTTPRSKGRKV